MNWNIIIVFGIIGGILYKLYDEFFSFKSDMRFLIMMMDENELIACLHLIMIDIRLHNKKFSRRRAVCLMIVSDLIKNTNRKIPLRYLISIKNRLSELCHINSGYYLLTTLSYGGYIGLDLYHSNSIIESVFGKPLNYYFISDSFSSYGRMILHRSTKDRYKDYCFSTA